MRHLASPTFWVAYRALPEEIRRLADKNFTLLKADPRHPSLHFKTVGNGQYHSVRVGIYHRALGLPVPDGVHWFWIGTHGEYDKIVG